MTLTYNIKAEDGQYSAVCEELDTASCGDTVDEALANLEEAIEVDLATQVDLGERDRFLRDRGIV
ncbi:MAG: type II toxin-antitoxin system HicB family antitoxin [Candidatus Hydrogenedentota bacterium]